MTVREVNIILVAMTVFMCIFFSFTNKEKRAVWLVAAIGWFVALINL